jgi:hypothetical protein
MNTTAVNFTTPLFAEIVQRTQRVFGDHNKRLFQARVGDYSLQYKAPAPSSSFSHELQFQPGSNRTYTASAPGTNDAKTSNSHMQQMHIITGFARSESGGLHFGSDPGGKFFTMRSDPESQQQQQQQQQEEEEANPSPKPTPAPAPHPIGSWFCDSIYAYEMNRTRGGWAIYRQTDSSLPVATRYKYFVDDVGRFAGAIYSITALYDSKCYKTLVKNTPMCRKLLPQAFDNCTMEETQMQTQVSLR